MIPPRPSHTTHTTHTLARAEESTSRFRLLFFISCILIFSLLTDVSSAQQNTGSSTSDETRASATSTEETGPRSVTQILLDEIERLKEHIEQLRQALAESELQAAHSQRELEEMRQFIEDHHEYGKDFTQYRAVKEVAEREAREKELEAARQRYEAEKNARKERYQAAKEERDKRQSELRRQSKYRKSGFTALGLDVYISKMAYSYRTKDATQAHIDYIPGQGNYLRVTPNYDEIDFSSMIISGSVLNSSKEVHNIGVAITFFDEYGNQVGHEIIQVNNARPDTPYPFTSTIDMALNRPFDSSSSYVLYADPIIVEKNEQEEP